MEKYDYHDAVFQDVLQRIEDDRDLFVEMYEEKGSDDFKEALHDLFWVDDSITGNASGSYTFNSYMAEEYLCHNEDLLLEALQEFGCEDFKIFHSPETLDVSIRCYLLYEAIDQVVRMLESDGTFGEADDEEDE